jgi:hypothetical protein
MGFSIPLASSPFPWVLLAGLFTGAALSRALRPVRPFGMRRRESSAAPGSGPRDDHRRTAKWMFFTLYLSLALVMALGALFVPGPAKILDIRLLYFYGGSTVLFFLVFRFRRVLGPIAVVLLIALTITVLLFAQAMTAFTGETEIGRVRVLSAKGGQMKLEIQPEKGSPFIIPMDGTYFAPIVRVVIFDDYFVFLGAKSWYRFEGMTSFTMEKQQSGTVLRQQDTDFYFPVQSGVPEALWSFYERHERWIPGIRSVQTEMDLKRARELSVYSLRVQNDGGLQIVPIS